MNAEILPAQTEQRALTMNMTNLERRRPNVGLPTLIRRWTFGRFMTPKRVRKPGLRSRSLTCLVACAAVTLVCAPRRSNAAEFLSPAQITSGITDPSHRAAIEQAIPDKAPATPQGRRRLLIFDGNVGYGGHPSAAHANYAFMLMGQRTKSFEVVVSRDPSVFEQETLRTFNAVFFNNTVGNLFETARLRQNLVEFVLGGGGLLGVHGTSVAFTRWPGAHEDWPEFGNMLGARGANHRESDEHVFIQLDDPDHPLNRPFGGRDFEYRDEFFRVHEPYSRSRLRVLFRIDTAKTDLNQGPARGSCERADNDYALAWIRSYGRGRVFYCTIAHNPYVFRDPLMLQFYLGAIQFALGDLPAPTTPSARLSPSVRAQEKLGWRLAFPGQSGNDLTLFESMDRAAHLDLVYFGGASDQTIGPGLTRDFGPDLTAAQREQVRLRLDTTGLRLLSYRLPRLPADPQEGRRVFEFARAMGVEVLIVDACPDRLEAADALCEEFDLALAFGADRPGASQPADFLRQCSGRSRRIGVRVNLDNWQRVGIDPVEGVRLLDQRLFVLQLPVTSPDLAVEPPKLVAIESVLREVRRRGATPLLFELGPGESVSSVTALPAQIEAFNEIAVRLAL